MGRLLLQDVFINTPTHTPANSGKLWIVATALIGQSDRGEAALLWYHRALRPPPAGKAGEVSCPRTQRLRWTEWEPNRQPTNYRLNSYHIHSHTHAHTPAHTKLTSLAITYLWDSTQFSSPFSVLS